MDLAHHVVDGCAVIEVKEDRFEYPKTQVLKNYALRLLEEKHSFLALDLRNVQMLDSFGIAVFISILKACKKEKGNLTLFGLNEQVTYLMELTRMDRVLDIWQDEAQAVAHVRD